MEHCLSHQSVCFRHEKRRAQLPNDAVEVSDAFLIKQRAAGGRTTVGLGGAGVTFQPSNVSRRGRGTDCLPVTVEVGERRRRDLRAVGLPGPPLKGQRALLLQPPRRHRCCCRRRFCLLHPAAAALTLCLWTRCSALVPESSSCPRQEWWSPRSWAGRAPARPPATAAPTAPASWAAAPTAATPPAGPGEAYARAGPPWCPRTTGTSAA